MKVRKLFQDKFEKKLKNKTILFNRYCITQFIGKGSYGQVYEAIDRSTNQKVVVKQLRRHKLMSTEGIKSYIREATILNKLNHASIPKLISNFQLDNQRYIVMEHVDGKNFEDLIFHEGHVYNEQQSFEILYSILKIVQYIHEQKVVHRDLRIPNIMKKDNQFYIIDFGLARSLDDNVLPESDLYPEEKKLMREVAYRSDFFALGHFILFLLYSSYTPITDEERSWDEELSISPKSKQIIKRMLQTDEPYETIHELILDIKDLI